MKKLILLLLSLVLSTNTKGFVANNVEETHVLILAGGKSKRMESSIPKVLHKLNGIPLIDYVISLARNIKSNSISIVTSPDLKSDLLSKNINLIVQDKPLGTGHAVLSARSWIKDKKGNLFILFVLPLLLW